LDRCNIKQTYRFSARSFVFASIPSMVFFHYFPDKAWFDMAITGIGYLNVNPDIENQS